MSKLGANIRSFTVGTPGDPADEADDAGVTAKLLGIPHEIIQLPPGEQPALDDLINAFGEPFACSSALAMLRVSRAVKEKATVLLTGDGGDDVYLGYTHHRNFLRAQRLANLLPETAAWIWPTVRPAISSASRLAPAMRRAMHLMDFATGGLGAANRVHDGLPYYEREGMLGDRLTGRTLSQRATPDSFQSARQLLGDFLEYERKTRFVSEYMTKVDGATMYYAIEARSPFLDQRMWKARHPCPSKCISGRNPEGGPSRTGSPPRQPFRCLTAEAGVHGAGRALARLRLEGTAQLVIKRRILSGNRGLAGPWGVGETIERAAREDVYLPSYGSLIVLEHWLQRNESQRPLLKCAPAV